MADLLFSTLQIGEFLALARLALVGKGTGSWFSRAVSEVGARILRVSRALPRGGEFSGWKLTYGY
jgi:hypothetical protein